MNVPFVGSRLFSVNTYKWNHYNPALSSRAVLVKRSVGTSEYRRTKRRVFKRRAQQCSQKGKLFGNIAKPSVLLVCFRVRHTHTSKYWWLEFSCVWRSKRRRLEDEISTQSRGLEGKKMKEQSIWRFRKWHRTGGSRKTDGLNQASDGKS